MHVRLIELDDAAYIRILDLHPVLDAMQEPVLLFLRQVPWCDEVEHQIDELLRLRTIAGCDEAVFRMLLSRQLCAVGGMPDTEIVEAALRGELGEDVRQHCPVKAGLIVVVDRVHVDHQVDAELCLAVVLDPVDKVMGAFDVAAAVDLGVNGGHVLIRAVVVDDQVMASEDAWITLDEVDDGVEKLRIDGVADQRCQGLPCDADAVPDDDHGDEQADIGIDVPVKKMENQEGREGRRGRQDIHEGILARRTVDV